GLLSNLGSLADQREDLVAIFAHAPRVHARQLRERRGILRLRHRDAGQHRRRGDAGRRDASVPGALVAPAPQRVEQVLLGGAQLRRRGSAGAAPRPADGAGPLGAVERGEDLIAEAFALPWAEAAHAYELFAIARRPPRQLEEGGIVQDAVGGAIALLGDRV